MPESTSDSIPHLTPRAVVFLLWLAIANDWLTRHMGVSFNSPIFLGVLGALGFGFGALEAATGEKLKQKWIGKAVRKILNVPVLAGLYAALLIALAGWSSVTVLNDPPNSPIAAALSPADGTGGDPARSNNKAAPAKPVQFPAVWVGAFGRPYKLDVQGYLPRMLNVYPLIGVSVSPRTDLRVTPSVLLRPPWNALGPMAGGVKVELTMDDGRGIEAVADATVGSQSILVGTDQPIPPAWLESWRLEAVAQKITNDAMLAQLLECWKKPRVVPPQLPLEPGRILRAIVKNPTGDPLAEASVRLGEERFQDFAMNLATPPEGARRN